MELSCFFPVFEGDNAKGFFEKFLKSNFFCNHNFSKIFVCASYDDQKNTKDLTSLAKKNPSIELFLCKGKFTFNDAFAFCLPKFCADALLFGDCKIKNIDGLFEKCLEKNQKGANIVHVCKKHNKFKGFFVQASQKIYNTFVWLFTGRREKCNQISLGLVDKNILDVLKTLPAKACFLKNSKQFFGFKPRTIYISDRVSTYEPKLTAPNFSLKMVAVFSGILASLCFLLFALAIASASASILVNFLLGFSAFLSGIVALIFWQKHKFDTRNMPSEQTVKFETTTTHKQKKFDA